MKEADELFHEMKEKGLNPNALTYVTLMSGHGKIGNYRESVKVYCEMINEGLVPTTGTYNVLINGFSKVGKMAQARELLKEMQLRGALPNSSTYDILISGLCDLSNQPELDRASKMSCLTEVKNLLLEMSDKQLTPSETTVHNISSMFAKRGKKFDAHQFSKGLFKRNNI
ncbi:hypothetical protein V6N12_014465 [Hibiscus sabdariffa]|uniref:Pentatricopeptide repeat-containing protein n=1 Tax=Hibiscus sabdariffa TaxID=183260 RepID=A0ABR2DK87_9ROSI